MSGTIVGVPLRFRSADGRYGLSLAVADTTRLLRLCSGAAHIETGGLLLGRYSFSHDTAVVTRVTGPARDAGAGPTWFERGTRGLQRLVDVAWKRQGEYYLGEWHFHPTAAPTPSATDRRTMQSIAVSPAYRCPEPVLLIVGGEPTGAWSASAHVFRRAERPVELTPF